jgi:hypothetical protein
LGPLGIEANKRIARAIAEGTPRRRRAAIVFMLVMAAVLGLPLVLLLIDTVMPWVT